MTEDSPKKKAATSVRTTTITEGLRAGLLGFAAG
jgi:hypothetical protein